MQSRLEKQSWVQIINQVINYDEYSTAEITSVVPSVLNPKMNPNTSRVAEAAESEESTTVQADVSESKTNVKLEDLIVEEVPEKPWQHEKSFPSRASWQSAALRRRMHHRRTNVSLGVCTVDLSGPPRPGQPHITRAMGRYFLMLTVRPDLTIQTYEIGTQTGSEDTETESSCRPEERPALLYAAILGSKDEAPGEIKKLLAQINTDHANFPNEVLFHIHSDQGGEVAGKHWKEYCASHGIHRATTVGFDRNAHSAESAVGRLKNRATFLLAGARFPTNWWGVAVLAAAQLFRADAGLEPYPKLLLGIRVMVIRDPKSSSAFLPKAEPATIFGPASEMSQGYWAFQKNAIKCRAHFAEAGLNSEELVWVKTNIENWDPPNAPMPLPENHFYDAGSVVLSIDCGAGAIRLTATCLACIAICRKSKVSDPHNLRWGECMRACPPPQTTKQVGSDDPNPKSGIFPPALEEEVQFPELLEDDEEAVEEELFTGRVQESFVDTFLEQPHACLAWSGEASWGFEDGSETEAFKSDDGLSLSETSDPEDWIVQSGFFFTELFSVGTNGDEDDEQTETAATGEENGPRSSSESETGKVASAEASHDDPEQDWEPILNEHETQKKKRPRHSRDPDVVASVLSNDPHLSVAEKEAIAQLEKKEGGKKIAPAQDVRTSFGAKQESWKLAAEAELTQNFYKLGAFRVSTSEEKAKHGKPLPMLCVWSRQGHGPAQVSSMCMRKFRSS